MSAYYSQSQSLQSESSEQVCRSCQSPALHLDISQGDLICTNCGVVFEDHVMHLGPEWRDFDSTEDIIKNMGSGGNARSGGVLVDESRFIGGLEPTCMSGTVYGGAYGAGVGHGAAGTRNGANNAGNLIKTHRYVENFFEKQWKKRMDQTKILLDIKKKNSAQPDNNNNDNVNNTNNINSNSDYGMAEQEQLIQMEETKLIQDRLAVVSDKWSLDRALFLHGAPHEIPSHYTTINNINSNNNSRNNNNMDVESQKRSLKSKMDDAQKKASLDVYRAYKLITAALKRLHLHNDISLRNNTLEMMCRYGKTKEKSGGFVLKGISTRLTTCPTTDTNTKTNSAADKTINDDKKRTLMEQQKEWNKLRQIAAIGSAFIYLVCKKNRLGRTLLDICHSFDAADCNPTLFMLQHNITNTATAANTNTITRTGAAGGKKESFVKLKHCSKGMSEIKSLFPEFVQSVTIGSQQQSSSLTSSSSSSSFSTTTKNLHNVPLSKRKNPSNQSDNTSNHISNDRQNNSQQQDKINQRDETTSSNTTMMTDLVEHQTRKLRLSPIALKAITMLVLHCRQEQMNFGLGSGTKPVTLIASVTLLVCEAGAQMEKLAQTRLDSFVDSNSISSGKSKSKTGKRKHESSKSSSSSSSSGSSSCGRRAKKKIKLEHDDNTNTIKTLNTKTREVVQSKTKDDRMKLKLEMEMEPETVTSSSNSLSSNKVKVNSEWESYPLTTDMTTTEDMKFDPSWNQWSRVEKSWHRDMKQIAQSCSTSSAVLRDYYRKYVYPRRKSLLQLLQEQVKVDMSSSSAVSSSRSMMLLQNIAVAAPLLRGKVA